MNYIIIIFPEYDIPLQWVPNLSRTIRGPRYFSDSFFDSWVIQINFANMKMVLLTLMLGAGERVQKGIAYWNKQNNDVPAPNCMLKV